MNAESLVSSSRYVGVESIVDLCTFVDELPPFVTGQLSVTTRSSARAGAVFVEQGRICWAAARGLSQRLGDLLAEAASVDRHHMEDLYDECRTRRAPLGEHLVERGIVSARDLRAALLRHTAESLDVLCEPGAAAEWSPRRSGGYGPRYTFSTSELLARTLAQRHPGLAERVSGELEALFERSDSAAAFVRSATRAAPSPIALFGESPEKIETLLRLGRWASSAIDVVKPCHEDDGFIAAMAGGRAVVAWRFESSVVAGFTGPHGPARILNRRAARRVAA